MGILVDALTGRGKARSERLLQLYEGSKVTDSVEALEAQMDKLFDLDASVVRQVRAKKFNAVGIKNDVLKMKAVATTMSGVLGDITTSTPSKVAANMKMPEGSWAHRYLTSGVQKAMKTLYYHVRALRAILDVVESIVDGCDGNCYSELSTQLNFLKSSSKVVNDRFVSELKLKISMALG